MVSQWFCFACNHHQGGDSFGFRVFPSKRIGGKQMRNMRFSILLFHHLVLCDLKMNKSKKTVFLCAVEEHCGSRTDTASSSVIRHNSYGGEGWSLDVSKV